MSKRSVVKRPQPSNLTSFSQLLMTFLAFGTVNLLLMLVANVIFPEFIVLGTHRFSFIRALFQSMLFFTLITVSMIPLIETLSEKTQNQLQDRDWLVIFGVVNTLGLWVTARLAEELGLGLVSWNVALVLGIIFALFEIAVTKLFLQPNSD